MAEETVGERLTRELRRRLYLAARFHDMEAARIVQNLDYFQAGSASRLRTVRYRLEREIDGAQELIERFYKQDINEIYRAGMIAGGMDSDYIPTAGDRRLLSGVRKASLNRTRAVSQQARNEARNVRKFRRVSRDDAVALRNQNILRPTIGGSRWNHGRYHTQMIRTDAQKAFNLGKLQAGKKQNVVAYRVFDGADCGLTGHDDPFKVNGEIMSQTDARKYILAHPNCQREFEPLKGEPKPKPILGRRRQFLKGVQRAASAIANNVEVDLVGLALDLAADERLRQVVFDAALKSREQWRGFRRRLDAFLKRITGRAPDEEEVFRRMIEHIDNLAEGQAAPSWVLEILDAQEPLMLKTASEEFVRFSRITMTKNATHAELNMINDLENHYGHFFQARLSAAHPNAADSLIDLYRGVHRHYNEPIFRAAKFTASTPRLGGDAFRGGRFTWRSRPLRMQTTVVNTQRHLTREELRSLMLLRGKIPVNVRVGEGAFGDILYSMTRQEMIRALGYNPGLLSHLTVNPRGLFRLGFRISPSGWIQPDIRIVPTNIPLRYQARLNRGRLVDGVRIRTVTQEIRAVMGPNIGADFGTAGRIALPSVGASFSTTIGRIDNFDDLMQVLRNSISPSANLKNQNINVLRSQVRFLGVSRSRAGAMSRNELVAILEENGAGLSGIEMMLRNSELISLFAEMRLMGWGPFEISRILRIHPDEARLALQAVDRIYGNAWREGGMKLLMFRAADQVVDALDAGAEFALRQPGELAREKWRQTQLALDDFSEWLSTAGSNTFAGKIYSDVIDGRQFILDFQQGIGQVVAENYGEFTFETLSKQLFQTSKSIAATVGYDLKNSASSLVAKLLNDARILKESIGYGIRIADGQMVFGNGLFLDLPNPGARVRNGFALLDDAQATARQAMGRMAEAIGQVIVEHHEELIKKMTRAVERISLAKANMTEGGRARMNDLEYWMQIRINEAQNFVQEIGSAFDELVRDLNGGGSGRTARARIRRLFSEDKIDDNLPGDQEIVDPSLSGKVTREDNPI